MATRRAAGTCLTGGAATYPGRRIFSRYFQRASCTPRSTERALELRSRHARSTTGRPLHARVDLGYVETDGKLLQLTPRLFEVGYSYLAAWSGRKGCGVAAGSAYGVSTARPTSLP